MGEGVVFNEPLACLGQHGAASRVVDAAAHNLVTVAAPGRVLHPAPQPHSVPPLRPLLHRYLHPQIEGLGIQGLNIELKVEVRVHTSANSADCDSVSFMTSFMKGDLPSMIMRLSLLLACAVRRCMLHETSRS